MRPPPLSSFGQAQGGGDAQAFHSAIGDGSRDRAARRGALFRRARSGQDGARRGRHAERLHDAGRRPRRVRRGARDRAQHQPARADRARDRRHRGVDQDPLHRGLAQGMVELLRHPAARAEGEADRGAFARRPRLRIVGRARSAAGGCARGQGALQRVPAGIVEHRAHSCAGAASIPCSSPAR